MADFIQLTRQYSDQDMNVLVNPVMIEFIEKRIWNGKCHSEVGLFSGKSYEVSETPDQIIKLIRKATKSITFSNYIANGKHE